MLELSRPIDPHTDVKVTVVNAAPFFGLDTRLPDGTRYVLLLAVSTEPGECEARPDGLALVLDASASFSIYATVPAPKPTPKPTPVPAAAADGAKKKI